MKISMTISGALSISGLDTDPREAFGWRSRFSRATAVARLTFPEPAVPSEQGRPRGRTR